MQRSGYETGTVLKSEGIRAQIITNKSKACKECAKAQAGICGKKGSGIVINAKNRIGAKEGDTVIIELEKTVHIKAYFLAFIFPVIALFVFTYIGYSVSLKTGINHLDVTLGFAGLILSVMYSLRKINKLDKSSEFHVARIMNSSSPADAVSCSEEIDYLEAFKKIK